MSDPAADGERCPRCGAALHTEQAWCLSCGAPARTRLAPTPPWRVPILALGLVVAVSLVALAAAFVELTKDPPGPVPTTPTTQLAPTPAPQPPTPQPPATPPPPPSTPEPPGVTLPDDATGG